MSAAPGGRARRARAGAEQAARLLRRFALSFPEAHEDFPWGESVVKVRGKVFVFFGRGEDGGLSLSVKLPGSATLALDLPFASPTAYGLGRSGWVTARFARRERPPVAVLERWIDESYRAVAPKRLAALLDAGAPGVEDDGASASRRRGSPRSGNRPSAPRAPARRRPARP